MIATRAARGLLSPPSPPPLVPPHPSPPRRFEIFIATVTRIRVSPGVEERRRPGLASPSPPPPPPLAKLTLWTLGLFPYLPRNGFNGFITVGRYPMESNKPECTKEECNSALRSESVTYFRVSHDSASKERTCYRCYRDSAAPCVSAAATHPMYY